MIILLTGYTGFVGSSLLEFFQNKDKIKKIICLGRKKPLIKSHKIFFIKKNFHIKKKLKIRKIDIVIHALGANEIDSKDKELALKNTFETTVNLIDSLTKIPITKIIYFSTAQVYGETSKINDNTATNSKNFYSVTHEMSENLIKLKTGKNIKNYIIVRPFNLFGFPKSKIINRKTLVPTCFIESLKKLKIIKLHSNGRQYRDFLSLDELNKKIFLLMKLKKFNNKTVNIFSGTSLTIKNIAEITLKVFKKTNNQKAKLMVNNMDKKKYKKLIIKSKLFKKINKKILKYKLESEIKKYLTFYPTN
jgi:UDP-glucose 4-epimerase